jgi:hypothetical protein
MEQLYIRKGFPICEEMRKYLTIYEASRRPLVTYDFATAPLQISLYMRKILFSLYQCNLEQKLRRRRFLLSKELSPSPRPEPANISINSYLPFTIPFSLWVPGRGG